MTFTSGKLRFIDSDGATVPPPSRYDLAVVPQEPFLFASTVADNIGFGRPGVSASDVEWAARKAQIHEHAVGLEQVAIVRMELTLRLRDPAFLVLLAFLLAGCALLVPDPSAGYAVVTIDHKKPIMSADTALIAAGIVLGALFLPVYSLTLDIGHARDRRTRLDRLQLTSPVSRSVLSGARLIASFLFMLLTTVLSLLVISSFAARSSASRRSPRSGTSTSSTTCRRPSISWGSAPGRTSSP